MATRSRIFMSYRRSDSLTTTGRLYDRLVSHLDAKYIFKDMENIPAGKDYRSVLEAELSTCSVILIIIGNSWLSIIDADGKRRLDNPNDPVRLEVEMALARKDASVIPLLVDGASLPKPEELPDSIRQLHYRNAVRVRPDPDFRRDVEDLITKIKAVSSIDEDIRRGKMLRWGLIAFIALVFVIGLLVVMRPLYRGDLPVSLLTETFTSTVIPTFPPPPDGKIIVAVAQFEPLKNVAQRNVTQFIAADLKRNLEQNRITDTLLIREYAGVIHNSEEAQQVANANHAAIVIWGNYTPDFVTANLEIGNLSQFKNIKLEHSVIEATTNVQARMTDEQSQSLALPVLLMTLTLETANNDLYEALVNITSSSFIRGPHAEILGNTLSANVHKAFVSYLTDSTQALKLTNQALDLDPTNVLVLLFRSTLQFRLGNNDAAFTDLRTATRLGTKSWIAPLYLQFLYHFDLETFEDAIQEGSQVIEAQPDQWYPYYMRAMVYYLTRDYTRAQADLDQALALNPTTNFAHLLKFYLEMRAGNITHAKSLYDELLKKFPDFTFGARLVEIASGVNVPVRFKGIFDVFSTLLFERYEETKSAASGLLDANIVMPEYYIGRAFAECSTNEFQKAVDNLNLAEKLDDQNVLLYMVRAQSRLKLQDLIGATQDAAKVQALSTDPNIGYFMQLGISGKVSCKDYFDVVLPTLQPTASAAS